MFFFEFVWVFVRVFFPEKVHMSFIHSLFEAEKKKKTQKLKKNSFFIHSFDIPQKVDKKELFLGNKKIRYLWLHEAKKVIQNMTNHRCICQFFRICFSVRRSQQICVFFKFPPLTNFAAVARHAKSRNITFHYRCKFQFHSVLKYLDII